MARTLFWIGLVVLLGGALVWWLGGDDGAPDGPPVDPVAGGEPREDPETAPGLEPLDVAPGGGATVEVNAAPLPDGAVRVFGTVVTPDDEPAPGATVDLVVGSAFRDGTTTDTAGTFSIVIAPESMGDEYGAAIRVRDADGHGLLTPFVMRSNPAWPQQREVGSEIDLGTLTLLAGSSLDVKTLLPSGARPPVTVWFLSMTRSWGGVGLWARALADENGIASAEGLTEGTWRILATAEGAGRGQVFVKLPQETRETVEIELEEERIGTLTVLDAETEAPIAGATIVVQEFVQTPTGNFQQSLIPTPAVTATDAAGRIELRGLTALSSLTIFVSAEGYPKSSNRYGVAATAEVQLRRTDTDVTVKLARARTIAWPVVAGPECAVPADGTHVSLIAPAGSVQTSVPEGGVMQGGRLVVEGFGAGYASALAVAPDGSMARLWAKEGETEGPEIHFVPARTITATVTFPDGAPAPGFWVTAVNQGNNGLGSAETDEHGKAVITNLYGGEHSLVDVRISEQNIPWGGTKLATVNLQDGDANVEGRVRHAMRVTLRIRIDGEARLPEITDAVPTGGIGIQFGNTYGPSFDVDEERAEISFDFRPPSGMTEAWYRVTLPGYVPVSGKHPVPETPAPIVLDVELEKGGSIHVTGKLPEDGRHRVNVQKWDAEKGDWVAHHLQMMAMGGYARYDANQEVVLQPLETGRYRVIDVSNFVASAPVDVVAGGEPPSVVLDASKAGFVRGTVLAPDGVPLRGLRVLVEGGPDFGDPFRGVPLGGAPPPKGLWTQTNDEGEFWLRVPGTEALTLRADGPGLAPAADGGRVTVTKPREGVILRLERGSTARVRFATPLLSHFNRGTPRPLQVALYDAEAVGEPTRIVNGQLDGEGTELVFGVEPGTWTIWIDADPFAPVLLERVTLEEGETDLGEVAVSEGSKVTLEVLLKEGEAMPRMYLWAQHLGQPAYQRRANSGTQTTVSMTGLGAGRFRITAGSHMGTGEGRLDEEIEVDGTGEVKRVIDLTK